MPHPFAHPVDRRGSGCRKWDGLEEIFGRNDILPFWIADMDFPAPPGVTEALARKAAHPVYGYHTLDNPFYTAAIDWLAGRHGWKVEREWLLLAPGVVPSLSVAIMALTGPDDQVIIQPPVYPPFFSVIAKTGRQIVENPLRSENGCYTMDFDDLERKITPKTKLLLLCSPHNPVGRVWREDELRRLDEICRRRGIAVLSDEIHCDLVFKGSKHIPSATLSPAAAANTVAFVSPSKTFNIAGTYISFIIIPDSGKRRKVAALMDALAIGGGNLFGVAAAEAAYRTGESWLEGLLAYLEDNAAFLAEFVYAKMPGVKTRKPEGTYLAWLDFREAIQPSALDAFLVHKAGVGLNSGTSFGAQGAGFARMNFACPRALLQEGLEKIAAAL